MHLATSSIKYIIMYVHTNILIYIISSSSTYMLQSMTLQEDREPIQTHTQLDFSSR